MVNGHSLSGLSCVAILRMTTLLCISSHRAIRDNRHACSIDLTINAQCYQSGTRRSIQVTKTSKTASLTELFSHTMPVSMKW